MRKIMAMMVTLGFFVGGPVTAANKCLNREPLLASIQAYIMQGRSAASEIFNLQDGCWRDPEITIGMLERLPYTILYQKGNITYVYSIVVDEYKIPWFVAWMKIHDRTGQKT